MSNGTFYTSDKRPGHEANRSSLSNTEVKNAWRYTSTFPYVFTAQRLIMGRVSLYFILYFTGWIFNWSALFMKNEVLFGQEK
jgi:hypothetical protein